MAYCENFKKDKRREVILGVSTMTDNYSFMNQYNYTISF